MATDVERVIRSGVYLIASSGAVQQIRRKTKAGGLWEWMDDGGGRTEPGLTAANRKIVSTVARHRAFLALAPDTGSTDG